MLAVYFGTLVLARLAMSLVSSFLKPPAVAELPSIPIDAFKLCVINADLQLMVAPNSIGTLLGK